MDIGGEHIVLDEGVYEAVVFNSGSHIPGQDLPVDDGYILVDKDQNSISISIEACGRLKILGLLTEY